MSKIARFDPIYPAHAIERCGATFVFNENVTDKMFLRVKKEADLIFKKENLVSPPIPSAGFQFDPQRGVMIPLQAGANPITYQSIDGSLSCFIAPNTISISTGKYVRWQPFSGTIERIIIPLISIFDTVSSLTNVQLDYMDRFFWTGDWSNFSTDSLINKGSKIVSEYAASAKREWHSHVGWFDKIQSDSRRLTNINVDVIGSVKPGDSNIIPSVGIYTMMQDQSFNSDGNNEPSLASSLSEPLARLEILHTDLKELLAKVIVASMAERIALNARTN